MTGDGTEIEDSFFQIVANSPEVIALTKAGAEEVAGKARAIAPVDTGDYRDSIHVERTNRADRPEFAVVSDDEAAIVIESVHGTFGRALSGSADG